jgi:HAD superfamily hydrolase (TIGR01509 family)
LAELLGEEAPPVPGALDLLGRVADSGRLRAVASSSDGEIVDLVLRRLGIRERFQAVVNGTQVDHGKPEPDIFFEAASRLGVEPARCLVLEDSEAGTRAARAAGMACIGLKNPHSGDQDLSAAHHVVDSLDEVTEDLFARLCG